jgi:hypothetical protein
MSKRERGATAVIAMIAIIIVGCASSPSPRVPPGGISVSRMHIPGSRRWWLVYTKDGEKIDPDALPEAMADNDKAFALARSSNGEARVAELAALIGWPLLLFATPACELASRYDSRTVHEAVPLTTAGIGVAAMFGAVVFGTLSSRHLQRALRLFNESRPPPSPPPALDQPPFNGDGPVCPLGADC